MRLLTPPVKSVFLGPLTCENAAGKHRLSVLLGLIVMDDSTRAQATIRQEWQAAHNARLACLVRAQALIAAGVLTVPEVCVSLGCSEGTWYRWARELNLRELAADVVAEVDQAVRAAGADESTGVEDVADDPDFELALGSKGVWRR